MEKIKSYFEEKLKPKLIKIRDNLYDDYGKPSKELLMIIKLLSNILKVILVILLIIAYIAITILLTGSILVLIIFNPYIALIFCLISIIIILYALCRDYLDEKYQII